MVPESFMPKWIAYLANVNPVNYAVEGVRTTLIGPFDMHTFAWSLGVTLAFAAVAFAWSVSAFNGLRE